MDLKIEIHAGVHVIIWNDGSCRPATLAEIELWNELVKLREIAWHEHELYHDDYDGV